MVPTRWSHSPHGKGFDDSCSTNVSATRSLAFRRCPLAPTLTRFICLRFLSLGLPQSKVYVRKPRTVDDLKVSIREEIATVPQETATVPQEIATVPQETATVPQDVATVPQGIATMPQEIATVPQEIATVPQDVATVPQEIATVPQEIATVPL